MSFFHRLDRDHVFASLLLPHWFNSIITKSTVEKKNTVVEIIFYLKNTQTFLQPGVVSAVRLQKVQQGSPPPVKPERHNSGKMFQKKTVTCYPDKLLHLIWSSANSMKHPTHRGGQTFLQFMILISSNCAIIPESSCLERGQIIWGSAVSHLPYPSTISPLLFSTLLPFSVSRSLRFSFQQLSHCYCCPLACLCGFTAW